MTGELIILCGISGSGKSSFAKFLFDSNPQKYTIVNRDKIRELIFGYTEDSIVHYWAKTDVHKYEKEVTEYEDVLIYEGLNKGKTVIVDATHLKRSYLERFKYWNVKTYMNMLFTSLEECIDRDLQRSRRVGVDIITKQHRSFKGLIDNLYKNPIDFDKIELVQDKTKPNCTILDIDGTISEPCDRNIYDNIKCIDDHLQEHIFNAITNVENLIVCTGRSIDSSDATIKWLDKHNIKYKEIHFRKDKDFRKDWIVKEEMWKDISKRYNIELMYEDRNQVVRRARALGLNVAHVKYGNY